MNDQPQIIEDLNWWSVEKPGLDAWEIAALVVVAILLIALAILFYRRKKRAIPFFAAPDPREVALKALRELEALLSEEPREFVIRASQILRTYIQDRFHLRAMHRSTEEFLREARDDRQLSPAHQELLGDFLAQCDMVKFARRGMARPQMEALLHAARSFVEGTPAPALAEKK